KRRRAHRTRALGAWSSLAMALRRRGEGPQARPGSYAEGKNTGSAIFCANRVVPRGYIAALKRRDPSGQLVVVIGASHPRRPRARRSTSGPSLCGDRPDRREPTSGGPTTKRRRAAPNQPDPGARLYLGDPQGHGVII